MNKELIQYEDHIYSQVSDTYSLITKTIADTQNMLDDLKAIAKEKDDMISSLENEKQSLEFENEKLQSDNKQQIDKIAAYEKDMAFFENIKIDSVRLADLIVEKETELELLEKQKYEFEKDKLTILSENKKLKSDLDDKKRELSAKQQDYDSYVNTQRNVEKELNNRIQKLTQDNYLLSQKMKTVENEAKELKEQNNVAADEIEELRGKNDELISQLQEMSNKLNGNKDDISGDNNSDMEKTVSENEELKKQIDELNKDVEWLVGYAKGTDRKIKSYFNSHKKELEEHHNWLCNKPKDETYKKFFESNSEDDSENKNAGKPETSPKREKGLA